MTLGLGPPAGAGAQAEAEPIPSHMLSGFFENFSKATDFSLSFKISFRSEEERS